MGISHRFQSAINDSTEAASKGQVLPSHWNDTHSIEGFVFVSSADDLPEPVGGVIALEDNTTYVITTTVDLLGDRIVAGQNTAIIGGSSENSRLRSTGLTGTALITSVYSIPMRGITIEADIALNLDGDGTTTAIDWYGVNFTDCPTIGTIKDYTNVILTDCAIINSANMTFDGSIGTVGFNQCLFDGRPGQTTIIIASTATFSRRFRIIYSAFVVLSGETGINFSSSASVPVEAYILDTVNFSGGGTYTAGVTYSDNKAFWINNRGVQNTAAIGYYTMAANATATDIVTQGVPVKVAGTSTSSAFTQKFSHSNNRLTYTGALQRDFKVAITATLLAGANQRLGLLIAKNGTVISESENYATTSAVNRAENVKSQTIVTLTTNDYIEAFVVNIDAAVDITAEYLSNIIEALN